jgi:hypothetical protein
MTKRIGILSLILAAGMAGFQPVAALAQDRGYRDREFHNQAPRREERVFRGQERRDSHAPVRGTEWRSPYVERYHNDRSYGYVYAAPRYNRYYYEPARPYNCR